ncbi:MAG: ATP-binding protein, partial [Promethearchaeota archaeon]
KILEDWETFHAIREIIANAIDEELLTNTDKIQIYKKNDGKWIIRDFGRGLKYDHLTQKEDDEKLNNPHVIGKFGIGLKDALATFDRKGIDVLIKSPHGDITLGKSEKSDFNDIITLHAYIKAPSEPQMIGTEFIITGCNDNDIEMAKELFLRFSGERKIEVTKYGEVLEKKDEISKIYVNGIKVAEEENFLFSYNITSLNKNIRKALNRERTNVGRSAYSDRVKSILLSCKNKDIAKKLVNDLKNFEFGYLHDELKWQDVSIHACKLLNSLETVVFLTPEEQRNARDMVERARKNNFQIITIPENIKQKITGETDLSGEKIRDLEQFRLEWNESFSFEFVEIEDLRSNERKIFEKTNEILRYIGGKPKNVREIKISKKMSIDPFTFSESAGIWDSENEQIVIKRNQLKSVKSYAGTLLHEIAHAQSGASDISEGFENELTSIIGLILSKIV